MAAKLLLINPAPKRRRHAKKKRHARRRNPMPAGLAKFMHSRRRRHHGKRRALAHVRHRRRRNPIAVRGIFGQLVPMTMEAATGAAGSLVIDYLWGQVNPRLPASMQSAPGKVSVGDAVKIAATVTVGTLTNRVTRGFGMRAARGALTVQLERILRGFLPDNIKQQLAYAQPALVVPGTYWNGPNRGYRGAGLSRMGALQRPGGPTQLLSALQRPGGPTQLLSGNVGIAGQGEGLPLTY